MRDRIRLCGRLMKLAVAAIAALIFGGTIYLAISLAAGSAEIDGLLSNYLTGGQVQLAFGPAALTLLGLVALANLAIAATGLYAVWRIGDGFARSDVFSDSCGRWLRRLGATLLVGAVSTVFSRTIAIGVAMTVPDDGHMLVIGFGSNEAFLVLAGLMMLVLGHVMVLASAIDAENKAFV